MKPAKPGWPVPDPHRPVQRAVPRSPEPETRALDAAEVARLIAQARAQTAALAPKPPPTAHRAGALPRPPEPDRSGTFSAPARPLPRPAGALPRSMPALPRAPKAGAAQDRNVELSDLHARPPKSWSDQAPPHPSPSATGSKRWRTPGDPPARDLTVLVSAVAKRPEYRRRDPDAPHSSRTAAGQPRSANRPELRRRFAIGVLAIIALAVLWLGPRGSTTRAADRAGGAPPHDIAMLPAASAQLPPSSSDVTGVSGVSGVPATPAVPRTAPPPSPVAAVVDASPDASRRNLATAARAPRAGERPVSSPGEPASRAADPVNPSSSAVATAIEQLALGHQRQALAAYRQLAAAQPERPAYTAIARILQHKLRLRCTRGDDAFDPACQEASP